MVQTQEIEDGFALERIDVEIKMEKIRQSATHVSWDTLGQALKRNLTDKRYVFDPEGRLDVIHAVGIMKRNIPVDQKTNLTGKLKQLAEGLGCEISVTNDFIEFRNVAKEKNLDSSNYDLLLDVKCDNEKVVVCRIGYYERPPVFCRKAEELMNSGNFSSLRSLVYNMMLRVPNLPSRKDKLDCISSLDSIEKWLSSLNEEPTFDKVSSLPYGWLFPSDCLHLARIYYAVEPCYFYGVSRRHFDVSNDLENLPYLELCIVQSDKEVELPVGDVENPWTLTRSVGACFCLRFSVPMLFNRVTWEKLDKYLLRPSVVRQHVNIYKHTSRFNFEDSELILRTNLPSNIPQHCYCISADYLKDEQDVIVGEIYVQNIKNLDKIIALLRVQQMHNSLWESFLSISSGRWNGGNSVKMKVHPSSSRFEVQFSANDRIVVARFEIGRDLQWTASVEGSDGVTINSDINREVTAMLLKSHSIPCALTRVTSALGCRGSPDPADSQNDSSSVVSYFDKVGDAWLPVFTNKPPKMRHILELENDFSGGGLLASFKELEESCMPSVSRPEAAARNVRQQSDTSYAHAFTDLEAICQIAAEPWESENKVSTPVFAARHESSPAPRSGGLTQLSPLETARLRMVHSVGAATAVGLASASPDVFDFSDDRSAGSGSSFPSPSPVGNQFGYPATSPLGPSVRGGGTKRRARARKTANFGDRTPSTDSVLSGQDMMTGTTKKPRGKAPVRRPRGTRKTSGLPVSHSDMEAQRPTLQRSFSDYVNLSSTFPASVPSGDQMKSPAVEDDSDDDQCDPPPPPKGLVSSFPSPGLAASPTTRLPTSQAAAVQPSVSTASPQNAADSSPAPSTRVQPSRKNSLEGGLPPPKMKSVPPTLFQQRMNMASDLYDDGAESPPPPEERIPSTMSSTSQQSLVQATSTASPQTHSSPRGDSSNSNDGYNISTPPSKPEGSKLIIKIPKGPSRASPSVDIQKSKSLSMPKLERGEKRKKESRDKDRDKERGKESSESRRKRKAESGKERDKEHKRHKSSSSFLPPDMSKVPPPSPVLPFSTNALKNFKIPKREDAKDIPKEKESPTPAPAPQSSNLTSPSGSTSSSGPKSILKKNSSAAPPSLPLAPQMPRSGSYGGPQTSSPIKKHNAPMEQRRSVGMPPSSHLPANIPLPKGPPPLRSIPPAGAWVRPPTLIPSHIPPPPRSPSPDPNAMQIDDDANSPEDSLRIADD